MASEGDVVRTEASPSLGVATAPALTTADSRVERTNRMPKQFTNTGATKANEPVATQHAPKTIGDSMGFLVFWTLHESHYQETEVKLKANTAQVPDWMIQRIAGRTSRSAWKTSTQLGAKGKFSRLSADERRNNPEAIARYLVRDLNEESRVLIREVVLPDREKVKVENLAVLYLVNEDFVFELTDEGRDLDAQAFDELDKLLQAMTDRMATIKGQVNGGRIRGLILDWLKRHHRICVRGTGGVYFVPMPADQLYREELRWELEAIGTWVKADPLKGLFSVMELFDTESTSTDTLIESALEEVKTEAEEINTKLKEWKQNERMNDGSLAFSAGAMVDRADELAAKIEALVGSLGVEMAVAEGMAKRVRDKAQALAKEASAKVAAARKERKDQALNGADPQRKKDGKTGTAQARAKHKTL